MSRDRGGSERGSVAITVALALTLLLGFAALVVDVGLNWAARTSAQTAADSAALAGAAQLLSDGPAAAVATVGDYLNDNVAGLVSPPGDLVWATNGNLGDGEVVCWTLPGPAPDPPPGGLANCPGGSNALQVVTPPITVNYAFAGVFGESSNNVKATAAAGAGPAAPNNCVLCLLEPAAPNALLAVGGVDVTGGGIAVNSTSPAALVLSGAGDITADQIRVVGGFDDTGIGQFSPLPEVGGPPVADPLADLPIPDDLASPPLPVATPVQDITTDTTLGPGIYDHIDVSANAVLTLQEGVYVLTGSGLTVRQNARVVSSGDGVTIYLACAGYPSPCSGAGAQLQLLDNGRFLASPSGSEEYAGLSIFFDRGNSGLLRLASTAGLTLGGALYGVRAPLLVQPGAGDLQVNSLLVARSLTVADLGTVGVAYDPTVLLPGVGLPVLIR